MSKFALAGRSNGYWSAVNDPINCTAQSSKIPDEYQGRTVGLKIRHTATLVTNDIGYAGCVITGSLKEYLSNSPVLAGTKVLQTMNLTGAGPGAFAEHPDLTQLTAQFDRYRVVSQAVQVSFIGKESDAAGEIMLHTSQQTEAQLIQKDLDILRETQGTVTVPIPYLKSSPVVATANYDRPSFINIADVNVKQFPYTVIGVLGSAITQSILRVEMFTNIELIPKQDSLHEEMAAPAPNNQAHMDQVARHLTSARIHPAGIRSLAADGNRRLAGARMKAMPSGPGRNDRMHRSFTHQKNQRSKNRDTRRFGGRGKKYGNSFKLNYAKGVSWGHSKPKVYKRKKVAFY